MSGEPYWTYWCPPEGDHYVHPNELQVGIVSVDDEGNWRPLLVAAVVPPVHLDGYDDSDPFGLAWDQAEPFASTIRDALEAGPWKQKDGLEQWLITHGGSRYHFPSQLPPLAETEPGEGE